MTPRPHYFEEIEYDHADDVVLGYTVVILETLRLTSMELYEINPALSEEIDQAALKQARDGYNDNRETRLSDRAHFQRQ